MFHAVAVAVAVAAAAAVAAGAAAGAVVLWLMQLLVLLVLAHIAYAAQCNAWHNAGSVDACVIAAGFVGEASIDSDSPVGDKSDQHTHAVHAEVAADTEADNAVVTAADDAVDTAVENAMGEMVTTVSSPADPIVPRLSFDQQSPDSAATAVAGKQHPLRHLSPL